MPRTPPQPAKQRKRGPSRYRRSETSRLLKGAADAGLTVRGIEVDAVTGDLRVLVCKADDNGLLPALEDGNAK